MGVKRIFEVYHNCEPRDRGSNLGCDICSIYGDPIQRTFWQYPVRLLLSLLCLLNSALTTFEVGLLLIELRMDAGTWSYLVFMVFLQAVWSL